MIGRSVWNYEGVQSHLEGKVYSAIYPDIYPSVLPGYTVIEFRHVRASFQYHLQDLRYQPPAAVSHCNLVDRATVIHTGGLEFNCLHPGQNFSLSLCGPIFFFHFVQ